MDAEELDASITRTLQSIDSNFARANTVLNGLIRKARFVVRHSKQAHAKLVPWKDFLLGFAPAEMKAEFLAMEEADAAPASPAPAQAATAAAPSSRAEFDNSHLGLLSPSAATPFRQAEGDSFYMDGGAASDEEDDVQLFGVDESPAAGASPALPQLSSRATMLLRQPRGSSPGARTDGPMSAAELNLSAASTGLVDVEAGASMATPARGGDDLRLSRSAASFLSTLSPILPQPHLTVANATTPGPTSPRASPSTAGVQDGGGELASPDMPLPSAATQRVLQAGAAPAQGSAGAGAVFSEDEDEGEGGDGGGGSVGAGDFDLSLFPAPFRSGQAAEQLIEVWSLFAFEEVEEVADACQPPGDSALSAPDVATRTQLSQGKASLLLKLLTDKGLLRAFSWDGTQFWRRK